MKKGTFWPKNFIFSLVTKVNLLDDIIEYFQKFGDIDYLKFKNNHRSGTFFLIFSL